MYTEWRSRTASPYCPTLHQHQNSTDSNTSSPSCSDTGDMSTPPRHHAKTRRLPPLLPAQPASSGRPPGRGGTSPSGVMGHTYSSRGRPLQPHHQHQHHSSSGYHGLSDLRPEVVTSYLEENPEFLERFVLGHVSREQLERWLVKKAQHKPHRLKNGETTTTPLTGETTRRKSLTRWKLSAHSDKRRLLTDMTRDVHQYESPVQVLSDLALCVSTATGSDGHQLYLVDRTGKKVYRCTTDGEKLPNDVCTRPIGQGTSLAAYVAHSKDFVRVSNVKGDDRFPEGIPGLEYTVHSAIAQPIIQADLDVIGVLVLYRYADNPSFTEDDEEMYHSMTKQRKLNEFLLAVTKSIFQDIVSMDTVIMKIMNFAQSLVSADRASLFLVDHHSKELYARIFDVGNGVDARALEGGRQREIRFPMDKGVAGHVASTGEILNIPDAYADNRFNREVDMQTGYHTKTILCMPIYIRGNIIGVVQMVNKLHGAFTQSDEESFETFAIYCGLALHHAKLYDKIRRSEQKYKVALDVLSYHSQTSEEELEKYLRKPIPETIPGLTDYRFSPWAVDNDDKPIQVIYMFRDLFNMTRFDMENLFRFTLTVRKNYRNVPYHNWAHAFSVAHAMYTVIKTSINIFSPLEALGLFSAALCHDIDHRGKTNAFMVKNASPLAAIYSTSVMEHHHFNHTVSILQMIALFVACLCHDVDHRGYTNTFMVNSSSPLAAIYSTSTMEHHHFNQTITILQHEGHNIFKHLTSEEYKHVLGDIKHCILATDLALFFGNRARLKELKDKGDYSWQSKEHRRLTQAIAMTACDLCASIKPWDVQMDTVKVIFEEFYAQVPASRSMLMATCMTASDLCSMYKPWDLQVQLVHVIMEEFWQQGDEEKQRGIQPIPMMDRDKAEQLPNSQGDEEKAAGEKPLAMMDRDRQHELPSLEVGFLVGICLPCYELLADLLPETRPMVQGANANLQKWQALADKQKELEQERQTESSKS